MAVYGIALTPLFKHLASCYPEIGHKMVAFVDDLTGAGRLLKLRGFSKYLLDVGPEYDTFQNQSTYCIYTA